MEITLSCSGYEDCHSGFWDAQYIYRNVNPLTFFAIDEDGGDAIELDLEDAVIYHQGEAGFLEEAKRNTKTHPILFKNVLEKFLQKEDYVAVLNEGYYAVEYFA